MLSGLHQPEQTRLISTASGVGEKMVYFSVPCGTILISLFPFLPLPAPPPPIITKILVLALDQGLTH